MSIKVMSTVFEHSRLRGTRRLLLLGIADNTDDFGHAWPGLDTLSSKCLVSRSLVIRAIADVEVRSNELLVYRRIGYGNHYLVLTGMDRARRLDAIQRFCASLKITVEMLAKQHRRHVAEYVEKHAEDYAKRKAKRREKHQLHPDTSVSLTPPPLQVDTPQVYAGTHDPSLTIIEPITPAAKQSKPPTPLYSMAKAIMDAFRYDESRLTKQTRNVCYGVAKSLAEIKLMPEDVPELYAYVVKLSKAQRWSGFTPVALAKYANAWLRDRPSAQPVPEPELDGPHAFLKHKREERDRAREAAFLSAS